MLLLFGALNTCISLACLGVMCLRAVPVQLPSVEPRPPMRVVENVAIPFPIQRAALHVAADEDLSDLEIPVSIRDLAAYRDAASQAQGLVS